MLNLQLRDCIEEEAFEITTALRDTVLNEEDASLTQHISAEISELVCLILKAYQNQICDVEQSLADRPENLGFWINLSLPSAVGMIMDMMGYDNFAVIIKNKEVIQIINIARIQSILN